MDVVNSFLSNAFSKWNSIIISINITTTRRGSGGSVLHIINKPRVINTPTTMMMVA